MNRSLPISLAIALGCLLGCSDPGHWSQATIESKLKKELGLVSVTLTNLGGGLYTGAGQSAAGSVLTIKVTQKPDSKELSYGALDEQGKARAGAFRRH
jgi:hypothetical protein